jgi:hypothetical protein
MIHSEQTALFEQGRPSSRISGGFRPKLGPEELGFSKNIGGALTSRSILLYQAVKLFAIYQKVGLVQPPKHYVIDENRLGIPTLSSRQKTCAYLKQEYGFSEEILIFKGLFELHRIHEEEASLSLFLLAWARDALLRYGTSEILGTRPNEVLRSAEIFDVISGETENRYRENICEKIVGNWMASWTQSGHLSGRSNKFRAQVKAGPVALAFACLLSTLSGETGEKIFSSIWMQILDLNPEQARELAQKAKEIGLLDVYSMGGVTQISFPRLREIFPGKL